MQILSGVFEGKTTGTPISLLIENEDQRSKDYGEIKDQFRPGHADYTYWAKYTASATIAAAAAPPRARPRRASRPARSRARCWRTWCTSRWRSRAR